MSSTDVWISLIAFVVVYIALGVADGYLMIRFGRKALQEEPDEETAKEPEHPGPDMARAVTVSKTSRNSPGNPTVPEPTANRCGTQPWRRAASIRGLVPST